MKVFDPQMALSAAKPSLKAPQSQSDQDLRKAAKEFEAMFLNLVMKQMRETVPENDLFGDSSKTKVFQGMLDEEYSKMAGETKNYGLAEMIYKNLSRTKGGADEN